MSEDTYKRLRELMKSGDRPAAQKLLRMAIRHEDWGAASFAIEILQGAPQSVLIFRETITPSYITKEDHKMMGQKLDALAMKIGCRAGLFVPYGYEVSFVRPDEAGMEARATPADEPAQTPEEARLAREGEIWARINLSPLPVRVVQAQAAFRRDLLENNQSPCEGGHRFYVENDERRLSAAFWVRCTRCNLGRRVPVIPLLEEMVEDDTASIALMDWLHEELGPGYGHAVVDQAEVSHERAGAEQIAFRTALVTGLPESCPDGHHYYIDDSDDSGWTVECEACSLSVDIPDGLRQRCDTQQITPEQMLIGFLRAGGVLTGDIPEGNFTGTITAAPSNVEACRCEGRLCEIPAGRIAINGICETCGGPTIELVPADQECACDTPNAAFGDINICVTCQGYITARGQRNAEVR